MFGDNYEFKIDLDSDRNIYLQEVECTCLKHKKKERHLFINLLTHQRPCSECSKDEKGTSIYSRTKRDVFSLIEAFKKKHGDKFLYHDVPYSYISMKEYIWIKCKKHDWFFQQTPINHLNTTICCPKCIEEFKG